MKTNLVVLLAILSSFASAVVVIDNFANPLETPIIAGTLFVTPSSTTAQENPGGSSASADFNRFIRIEHVAGTSTSLSTVSVDTANDVFGYALPATATQVQLEMTYTSTDAVNGTDLVTSNDGLRFDFESIDDGGANYMENFEVRITDTDGDFQTVSDLEVDFNMTTLGNGSNTGRFFIPFTEFNDVNLDLTNIAEIFITILPRANLNNAADFTFAVVSAGPEVPEPGIVLVTFMLLLTMGFWRKKKL